MEKNHVKTLLPDYLDNTLSESEKNKVAAHIASCASCKNALTELSTLLNHIKDEPLVAASEQLRTNFFEQLETEKQNSSKVVSLDNRTDKKTKNWTPFLLKIAASIALLFVGYFFGQQQQVNRLDKEIAQLNHETLALKQTAVLSLIGNKSASKRIQGVQYIEELSAPNEAIVAAIADRMLHDENTNVRRTAVEVLSEFTVSESVKNSFIQALQTEQDPGIQITIIHLLGKIQEKNAIAPMQQMLDKENTKSYVKEELKSIISTII